MGVTSPYYYYYGAFAVIVPACVKWSSLNVRRVAQFSIVPAVWCSYSWHGRVVRGGTGDAEALACRADVVGFLYFEGLLLMRSAANDKVQVLL